MLDVTKIEFEIRDSMDPLPIMEGRLRLLVGMRIGPRYGRTFEHDKAIIADAIWKMAYGDLMPCLHRLDFALKCGNVEEAREKTARLLELLSRPEIPKGWPGK